MKYFFCLFMLCTLRLMGNTGGDTLVPLGKVMYRFETKCMRHTLQNGKVSLYFNSAYSMCVYEDVPKEDGIIENGHDMTPIYSDPDKMAQFVDFRKKAIIYKQNGRFLRHNILTEDLPKLDWKILTETKLIVGKKCQKATCSLGGRNYVAWFCAELPYPAGPYKFTGLPGLIFELESLDGFVKYSLLNIDLNKPANVIISAPSHGRNFTSKKDLIEADKKHHENKTKQMAAFIAQKGIKGASIYREAPINYFIEKEYEWGGSETE